MASYSEEQREYWAKAPGDIINYGCVIFEHDDINTFRLVADIVDHTFKFNSVDTLFTAVAMSTPEATQQAEDTTQAGVVKFGRIGLQFRKELQKITALGSLKSIRVTLLQYRSDKIDPIYERHLLVGNNGVSFDADFVNVRLAIDNTAKLTRVTQFYDAETWVGLQGV